MGVKRAVITGATGPLGTALAKYLSERGIHVTAIVNPRSRRIGDISVTVGVDVIQCDLSELTNLRDRLTRNFDAFFHLAWEATESRATRDDPSIHANNIVYTLNAVKLAHVLGCSTFVGAGSQVELTGLATDGPVFGEESYGIAKYAAGRLSAKLCGQLDMRQCWARVQSIYGPGERETTALMYCIRTLLKGEKPSLTKGEQLWDYLYSVDCARALCLIAEKGSNGVAYAVGSGQERPLREYFECIRDCIDPSLPLGLGEKEYLKGQPMRMCADIRTLTEDTGFSPEYSFHEGIMETIDWVRDRTNEARGDIDNA